MFAEFPAIHAFLKSTPGYSGSLPLAVWFERYRSDCFYADSPPDSPPAFVYALIGEHVLMNGIVFRYWWDMEDVPSSKHTPEFLAVRTFLKAAYTRLFARS